MRAVFLAEELSNPRPAPRHLRLVEPYDPVADVFARIERLPKPSRLYRRVAEAIEAGASAGDVVTILERDPILADKVARSFAPVFAQLRVQLLGYLVLGVAVFAPPDGDPVPGFSLDDELARSIQIALCASKLAPPSTRDLAFGGGLLCESGRVVLATSHPEAYAAIAATGAVTCERELDAFGVTHAEVGATLLEKWGVPRQVIDVVRFHHDAHAAPKSVRAIADLVGRACLE